MNGKSYRIASGFVRWRAWACIALFCLLPSLAGAQEAGWPRTLTVEQGLVTIYPLQAESLEGQVVRYRAALAYRATADAEPVFGAGWFESRVEIDRQARLVRPLDLRVLNSRFPEGTDDLQGSLAAAVASGSPGWNLDYSLDELDAALANAEAEEQSLQQLNTAPPRIVYRDRPALLVTLDGEPVLRPIENSELKAVINTPYPLIFDGRHYYLNAMQDVWYQAPSATGPFRYDARPPAAIAALVKPDDAATEAAPAEPVTAANAPEVVVATEPTELIVTDGPAVFVPLLDDLLVLQNSDDDVFMHLGSQQYYIVLAGRWYTAGTLNGPWSWQPADQLPAAFANIPPGSAQGDSRVYVAGTPEADDAVLAAQVPQAAAVERGPAEVDVSYDGQPDFRPVDGTDLRYAANTGAAVLQSDRQYFLVEDGVWYVADSPNGPWQVSTWRPQSVARIPPTSPVYHVKYVYIYDYTPEVVYVGYTPGYLGSYVYYDTVVYGTGWYYRPWVTPYYYYPRPSTWGFHVGYTSWGSWSFGLSWNWGWGWGWSPYYASYWTGGYWHRPHHWHHRHYGYWGPRGYHPRPAHHGYNGHHRYADHDRMPWRGDYRGQSRGDYRDDYRDGHRDGRGDGHSGGYRGRHDNLYRDDAQRARVVEAGHRPAPGSREFGPGQRRPAEPGRSGAYDRRARDEVVAANDLQLKAQIRDTNRAATRSPMVVDRQGKVRHKGERPPRLDSTTGPVAANSLNPGAQPSRPGRPDLDPVARGQREMARARAAEHGTRPAVRETRSVRPDATSVRPERRAVRPDAAPIRSEQRTVRPDATPVRPEQRSVRPDVTRARPEQRVVRPDAAPIRSEQRAVRPDATPVRPEQRAVRPDTTRARPEQRAVRPDAAPIRPETRTARAEPRGEPRQEPRFAPLPQAQRARPEAPQRAERSVAPDRSGQPERTRPGARRADRD